MLCRAVLISICLTLRTGCLRRGHQFRVWLLGDSRTSTCAGCSTESCAERWDRCHWDAYSSLRECAYKYNVTDFIKERVTRNLGLNLDTQSRRPTPPSVLSAAAQGPGLAFMIARLSGVSPSRPRWTGRARPRARRRGLHVTTRATSCCCSLVHCVIRRHLLDGIWIRRGIKWLPRSPVPGEDTSLDSAMHGTWPLVFLRCPAPAQVSTWVMPDSMAH